MDEYDVIKQQWGRSLPLFLLFLFSLFCAQSELFVSFGDAQHHASCFWIVQVRRYGSSFVGAIAPMLRIMQKGWHWPAYK
jgi:hypothetical protein